MEKDTWEELVELHKGSHSRLHDNFVTVTQQIDERLHASFQEIFNLFPIFLTFALAECWKGQRTGLSNFVVCFLDGISDKVNDCREDNTSTGLGNRYHCLECCLSNIILASIDIHEAGQDCWDESLVHNYNDILSRILIVHSLDLVSHPVSILIGNCVPEI